jgi:hypothetical protein
MTDRTAGVAAGAEKHSPRTGESCITDFEALDEVMTAFETHPKPSSSKRLRKCVKRMAECRSRAHSKPRWRQELKAHKGWANRRAKTTV